MSERPDYVACVSDSYREKKQSWCGRTISSEFAFISVDHAANSGRNEDRMVVCPECYQAIVTALQNGFK